MTVKNHLKHLIDREGITPYRFRQETGVHKITAYRLYNDPEYIPGKEVIEAIGNTYGWQPGDYIFFIPNKKRKGT